MVSNSESPTQIAHILFLDIVGWSKESIDAQGRLIGELSHLVSECPAFREARAADQLTAFPTGDGMWILFAGDLAGPARCATELAQRLGSQSLLAVRMGIHSGPVRTQIDITGARNIVGDGIIMARRVMDLGDAGHILLSSQYAGWLRQFDEWAPHVHRLGHAVTKHGEKLEICTLVSDRYGRLDPSDRITSLPAANESEASGSKLVIVYKRNAKPDDHVVAMLEQGLAAEGHVIFIDRQLKIGVEWAKAIERKIRGADAVVAIVSDSSVESEMLEYELETAHEEHQKRGRPYVLPIRVGSEWPVGGPVGSYVNGLNFSIWKGPEDDHRVLAEIKSALVEEPVLAKSDLKLEPIGGAVPPDSPFYAEREADAEFAQALRSNECIILIKGPRQMGKTSLIGRGGKVVRNLGWRVVMTDFQKLSSSQMSTDGSFYKLLAATMARQLKFKYDFEQAWLDVFGANMNMDNFVRALIDQSDKPLVWFMDEGDKLFGLSFASDFFGLVRSWHNSRATEPDGPWSRLTVVIGYATEAHLFIQDLNQSPFNVGRQIPLQPFSLEQTWDLNQRCGGPMKHKTEVETVQALLGGQPFLTRRALDVLARDKFSLTELIATATKDHGAFGDHLKRILIAVTQMPMVHEALKRSLTQPELNVQTEGFQRLVAAGVLKLNAENRAELACELYRRYFSEHLER